MNNVEGVLIFKLKIKLLFILLALVLSPGFYANAETINLDSQPYVTLGTPALTKSNLSDDGAVLFEVRFNNDNFTGDLIARTVDKFGNVSKDNFDEAGLIVTDGAKWRASRELSSKTPQARKIFTSDKSGNTVNFLWSNLNSEMKVRLDPAAEASQQNSLLVDWLRGSPANEGTLANQFMTRTSIWLGGDSYHNKMGSIVNSSPAFVGAPRQIISANQYSLFQETFRKRQHMVYVGSNSGMLHGFNANTGEELFAYVPYSVLDKLGAYSDSGNKQQVYSVDGAPTVQDAYGAFPLCGGGSCWRTILVSGLNGGGRGVFALDVTDPALMSNTNASAQSLFLWEFKANDTNQDGNIDLQDRDGNADLGYTFSKPIVVQLQDGTWAAVFGNGYNSSGSKKASLYVIDLATGELIKRVEVAEGSDGFSATDNGLSSPAAWDSNFDGFVDAVYAGDLKGNLWKFDFSNAKKNGQGINTSFNGKPLIKITSKTLSPEGQLITTPITTKPVVSLHPDSGVIVYFGTGIALDATHEIVTGDRSVFGIYDGNSSSTTSPPFGVYGGANNSVKLMEHDIGLSSRLRGIVTTTTPENRVGWVLNLGDSEQLLSDMVLSNQRLNFITTQSIIGQNNFNWLSSVDYLTGEAPISPVFDANSDGVINSNDTISIDGKEVVPIGGALGKAVASAPRIATAHSGNDVFIITLAVEIFTEFDDPFTDLGLSGGHFDQDEHYNPKFSFVYSNPLADFLRKQGALFGKRKHEHEYDDKHDTNGVQILYNETQNAKPLYPPNVESSTGLGKGFVGLRDGVFAGKFADASGDKIKVDQPLVLNIINPHSVDTKEWASKRASAGVSDDKIAKPATVYFVCDSLQESQQYPSQVRLSGEVVNVSGGISAPEFVNLPTAMRTCSAKNLSEFVIKYNDINAMRAAEPKCVKDGIKNGIDGPILPPTHLLSAGQSQNTTYRNGAFTVQASKLNGEVVWENYNYEHIKDLTGVPKGRKVDCDSINEDLREYRTIPETGDDDSSVGPGDGDSGGPGVDEDRIEFPGEGGFSGFVGTPTITVDPYTGRSEDTVEFLTDPPKAQRKNWVEILPQ